MPSFIELNKEALKFRKLVDSCNKKDKELILEDFPLMSCKLVSFLLSFHYFQLWPEIEIIGVGGTAEGDRNGISHFWLEVEGYVIDITGDQYNTISSKELNKSIIQQRPFLPVHIENKNSSYLYNLFDISYRWPLKNYPDIRERFIEKMQRDYNKLIPVSPEN